MWFLTVITALLPSLLASDAGLSISIWQMAAETNAKGLFAEFYFVIIVIAIFGLGNVAHYGFTAQKRPHVWLAVAGLIAVGFYAVVLIHGTGRFGSLISLSRKGVVAADGIQPDVNLILWTMIVGLATELAISLRHAPQVD